MVPDNDWPSYKLLFEKTLDKLDGIEKDLSEIKMELVRVKIFFAILAIFAPMFFNFFLKKIASI